MIDGYPEEHELEKLRTWPADDFEGPLEYMQERWRWSDYILIHPSYTSVHTGGWSGHEEMLNALQKNFLWWGQYWYSSKRGGHHVFAKHGFIRGE